MDMIGKIRRLHARDKLSEREIARRTGLSRNTVSKWLRAPVKEAPKYRRDPRPNKLSPFEEALKRALTADARRPKHERRTARALHAEIKAAGYDGGYSAVTDFVRAWRQGEGQAVNVTAFVPLTFELGEAFQFDWSEEGLVVGGIYYRMQVSHLKLCASRAFWLVAYPTAPRFAMIVLVSPPCCAAAMISWPRGFSIPGPRTTTSGSTWREAESVRLEQSVSEASRSEKLTSATVPLLSLPNSACHLKFCASPSAKSVTSSFFAFLYTSRVKPDSETSTVLAMGRSACLARISRYHSMVAFLLPAVHSTPIRTL